MAGRRAARTPVQLAALAFGAVFLLIGVLGLGIVLGPDGTTVVTYDR